MKPAAPGFQEILSAERESLAALVRVLQKEQALLIDGQVTELPGVAAEKQALAECAAHLASRRNQSLGADGFAADRRGVEAWLEARGEKSDEATMWRDTLKLADAARSLNSTNGLLIEARLEANQRALNVLLGSAAGGALYGRNGQAQTATQPRPLESA